MSCHTSLWDYEYNIWESSIAARTRDSEQNDNSQTAQYEAMDFTNTTKSEEPEADVYLTIPDDGLSQDSENAAARSDSAIKRAEFAERLASMTDEDFLRQFQVTDDFIIVFNHLRERKWLLWAIRRIYFCCHFLQCPKTFWILNVFTWIFF